MNYFHPRTTYFSLRGVEHGGHSEKASDPTVTSQSLRIDKLVEIINKACVLNGFLDALFKSALKFMMLFICKTENA